MITRIMLLSWLCFGLTQFAEQRTGGQVFWSLLGGGVPALLPASFRSYNVARHLLPCPLHRHSQSLADAPQPPIDSPHDQSQLQETTTYNAFWLFRLKSGLQSGFGVISLQEGG